MFTDGVPTAFTAAFPVKKLADQRRDYRGGPCGGFDVSCNVPKSTCTDDTGKLHTAPGRGTFAPKVGVITGGGSGSASPSFGGDTPGLVASVAITFTGEPMIPAAQRAGCQMSVTSRRARYDLAYVPWTDANGYSTTGYQSGLITFDPGHVYQGFLRLDRHTNISQIAINLAATAAAVPRNNAILNVVTYTIGLGSNGGVDDILLERMANDLASPLYDNTKANGVYIFAPSSADLGGAVARIASEILRLAQ